MKISAFVSALALGMSLSSAAFALDATTPDKPDATAKAERAAECSKRADARGLHGKKRREYREECKKGKEDKISRTSNSSFLVGGILRLGRRRAGHFRFRTQNG